MSATAVQAAALAAARSWHARLRRAVEGFAPTLAIQIAAADRPLTWDLVGSAAAATGLLLVGEIWPTVPWGRLGALVETHLSHHTSE